jgi:hypothetical protein|tara:strand:- start:49 stop:423 length:375 start_codon:yes stop_codon:yes gene_type:complete
MKYLIAGDWDENNIIIVEGEAETEVSAEAMIAVMINEGRNALAFYAPDPGGRHGFKVVDPVAKTITFDQAGYDAKVAMGVWQAAMNKTDTLPRYIEDIYDNGVTPDDRTKALIDVKKTLRGERP